MNDIQDIKAICTPEEWKDVQPQIAAMNTDSIEAVRIMGCAGLIKNDIPLFIAAVKELTIRTPMNTTEASIAICRTINNLK